MDLLFPAFQPNLCSINWFTGGPEPYDRIQVTYPCACALDVTYENLQNHRRRRDEEQQDNQGDVQAQHKPAIVNSQILPETETVASTVIH